ncbi:hypothetical protein MTO96_014504 [Rhipicephalus appendiculatus]
MAGKSSGGRHPFSPLPFLAATAFFFFFHSRAVDRSSWMQVGAERPAPDDDDGRQKRDLCRTGISPADYGPRLLYTRRRHGVCVYRGRQAPCGELTWRVGDPTT